MCGSIVLLTGSRSGAIYPLESAEIFIGRSPDIEISLDDDGLSRVHARVYRANNNYYLEDLNSTNGTRVQGQRLKSPVVLTDGARIKLGNEVVLGFSLQDDLEQQAAREVYDRTVRDALTGLHNRRFFEDRLRTDFAYAVRHDSPLAVLILDIDHFKAVNDNHGHQAGDAVLARFGEILASVVRTEDLCARYGGEEFVVVTREARVGAFTLGERIRKAVQETRFMFQSREIPTTVSIGVGCIEEGHFATADALVATADEALYRAKSGGRNRVS